VKNDKKIEKKRYDLRAKYLLNNININEISLFGSASVPIQLRTPYIFYEEKIKKLIQPTHKVLEIGAGTGLHTYSLIKTGAHITATDISKNSLRMLKKNLANVKKGGSFTTFVADMENLPFENGIFDVVASAGSLSYGNSKMVDSEIRRVIKPSGIFICIDTLNHNPIYKINRYVHYLKGERSKMTLINMPTLGRFELLKQNFTKIEIKYFGSISYAMPLISIIIGKLRAKALSDKIDKLFRIKKSAFKFVLIANV